MNANMLPKAMELMTALRKQLAAKPAGERTHEMNELYASTVHNLAEILHHMGDFFFYLLFLKCKNYLLIFFKRPLSISACICSLFSLFSPSFMLFLQLRPRRQFYRSNWDLP